MNSLQKSNPVEAPIANRYISLRTFMLLRVEQRNFKNLNTKDWEQQYRPRARAETIIPINKDSYFVDKLWYAITDVEWLYKTDDVESDLPIASGGGLVQATG